METYFYHRIIILKLLHSHLFLEVLESHNSLLYFINEIQTSNYEEKNRIALCKLTIARKCQNCDIKIFVLIFVFIGRFFFFCIL